MQVLLVWMLLARVDERLRRRVRWSTTTWVIPATMCLTVRAVPVSQPLFAAREFSPLGQLDGPVTGVIDEVLARCWGRRIRLRGHYQDPLASSGEQSVWSSGLRWLVVAVVASLLPWAEKAWALTVFSVPAPDRRLMGAKAAGIKMVAERAAQVVHLLRRWLPEAQLTLSSNAPTVLLPASSLLLQIMRCTSRLSSHNPYHNPWNCSL